MISRALLLCFIVLYCAAVSSAQYGFKNLSSFNGLPSDHVYFILKDKHGYLWLATDKGIARYNGYEMNVFTIADGLINDDVFSMYEDRKGRIWLFALADNIGYMYNGTFHAAHITSNARFLRPYDMKSTASGVVFSNFVPWCHNDLYFEKDDTFYTYSALAGTTGIFFFDEFTGKVLLSKEHGIYECYPEQKQLLAQRSPYICSTPYKKEHLFHTYHVVQSYSNKLTAYNFRNGTTTTLLLSQGDETLYNYYSDKDRLLVITDRRVIVYDTLLHPIHIYGIPGLIDGADLTTRRLVSFFEDDFWGRVAGTSTSGVYIQQPDCFHPPKLTASKIPGFEGKYYDEQEKQIFRILDSLSERPARVTLENTDGHIPTASNKRISLLKDHRVFENPIRVNGSMYLISTTIGFCKIDMLEDTLKIQQINDRKYHLLRYDSLRRLIYLARHDEILVYGIENNACSFTIKRADLNRLGIRKISNILIDRYGDVFIKDQRKLFVYSAATHTFKELLKPFNLENTTVRLYSDTLMLVGATGVLGYTVYPNGRLRNQYHYINCGHNQYKKVYEWRYFQNEFELATDSGNFKIPVSSITGSNRLGPSEASFTLTYKGAIKNTEVQDTLVISQDNLLLEWDVILPHSTGKPQFNYTVNEKEHQSDGTASKAIFLSGLSPGTYHRLVLRCKDHIWRYEQPLTVYIEPFLWQTRKGVAFISAIAAGILVIFFFSATYISRRRATRLAEERNLQLQQRNAKLNTELKSIYAQINPHFIFNTLNTTAYFIKRNENKKAVSHLVAFSKLLRAYIRSSREKFITLKEELGNIENYLLLQQTRYEGRFSYKLQVGDTVDAEKKIPAFLIQPLVENAINHGLIHKEDPGLLKISVYSGDASDELYCVIDDNGIGREASRAYYNESGLRPASYGSDLINELIAMINSSNRMHIDISYEDKSTPETGTTVTIKITNSYEATT